MSLRARTAKALNTATAMLRARGVTTEETSRDLAEGLIHGPDCTVKVFAETIGEDAGGKIGINHVRDELRRRPVSLLICISGDGGTPFLQGRISEFANEGITVEVFRVAEVLQNITEHALVPKHTRVSGEKLQTLLREHGVTDVSHLPRLLASDPVVRFHGWQSGDVVSIDRQELGDNGMIQVCLALRLVS